MHKKNELNNSAPKWNYKHEVLTVLLHCPVYKHDDVLSVLLVLKSRCWWPIMFKNFVIVLINGMIKNGSSRINQRQMYTVISDE